MWDTSAPDPQSQRRQQQRPRCAALPFTWQPSSSKLTFGVGEPPGVTALGVRVTAAEPVTMGEAVGVPTPGVPVVAPVALGVAVVAVPPVGVTVALAVPAGEPVGVTAPLKVSR
jgi:hypothetical protein